MRSPEREEEPDEDRDADDVNARGEVVEHGDDPHREDIEDRVGREHRHEKRPARPRGPRERRGDRLGAPQVDGRDDRELPHEVHRRREPPPAGAAEPRRPVVERPRRRKRARELSHRERHDERPRADERPPEPERRGPPSSQRYAVGRRDPGEDADDRERQGEAREAPHRPEELLRVPQPRQVARIGVVARIAARPRRGHVVGRGRPLMHSTRRGDASSRDTSRRRR